MEDLLKIVKTAEEDTQQDKLEFKELTNYVKKLADKDLSDWLSKSGLQSIEEIVQRKQENKNNFVVANLWIEKRYASAGSFEGPLKIISQTLVPPLYFITYLIRQEMATDIVKPNKRNQEKLP